MNKALIVGALISYAAALRINEVNNPANSDTNTVLTPKCECCGQTISDQP